MPAFQFYPGDWMKDPSLRACSAAARGLWMDMLCLMFESDRRGFLQAPNGKPYSPDQLARMTGCSPDEVSHLLAELETSGVFSRTKNGTIFSRRLKRDEELRAENRSRQHSYRKQMKTKENGDTLVTQDVTPMSHPSSSSSSIQNTIPHAPEEVETDAPESPPDWNADPLDTIPRDAPPMMCAALVLERADILALPHLVRKFGDAIKLLAKVERIGIPEATRTMLARVLRAQGTGESRWDFWLADGGWRAAPVATGASVGIYQGNRADQDADSGFALEHMLESLRAKICAHGGVPSASRSLDVLRAELSRTLSTNRNQEEAHASA